MEKLVVSVSQLNNYLKGLFDEIPVFRNVYVSGEISNFTNHYRTGHFYFSLKDSKSVIKAVMFSSYASRLKFMPESGMEVLVKARLSVYEKSGEYQLYVEDMQPKGLGGLNLAYEQLKNKLAEEGLFDDSRKKAIPRYPSKIGIITSPTGAAIRDIMHILSRRYPIAETQLEPVLVQGDEAPMQLVKAIKHLNDNSDCDVIIIGRGGGSIEDLWAFNEEKVARAVAESNIPIISGVGHETDFTITDFVADLRAPTPSAAAEMAVPNIADVILSLNSYKSALMSAVNLRLKRERAVLDGIKSRPCMKNIKFVIDEQRIALDTLSIKCTELAVNRCKIERQNLVNSVSRLEALSPLKVLARGYSVVKSGTVPVLSSNDIEIGDTLKIEFSKGSAECKVTRKEVLNG